MKRFVLIVLALLLVVSFGLNAQEENKKLKPDEAEQLIQQYTQQAEQLKAQLDQEKATVTDLQAEVDSLKNVIDELNAKIAELEKQIEEQSYYVVKPGDWLSKLAEYPDVYGHGNYAKWREIYKANKDLIQDPDLILPGWKLKIPRP